MAADTGFVSPPYTEEIFGRLLKLNNDHAEELSYKTREGFAALMAAASHVRAEPEGLALLVAFDEACTYDNANFAWLSARFKKFYYIDRVVVSADARGRGLARAFYTGLEERARQEGRERLVCEINSVPPNPQSDAFHKALGFSPIGERAVESEPKVVRYWAKELG